jgi:hypothetical protein
LTIQNVLCSRAKKLSMAALSPAAPTRPIEPTRPCRARVDTNLRDRNWRAITVRRDFLRESME